MTAWPTTPQAIKARISSYRRILRQEAASPGGFGDGRGKRFLLFTLYFQLREDDEARAYMDWYRVTFPEDHGHAESFLCWALILRRLGREDEAVYRFVQAIDNNLPVLADVVGDLHAPYGMGEEIWQAYRVVSPVIDAMIAEEHVWLRSAWRSPAVVAMRERYIAIGRALITEPVGASRSALVREQSALARAFMPKKMPPLAAGADWLLNRRVAASPRSNRKVIRTTPETWQRG